MAKSVRTFKEVLGDYITTVDGEKYVLLEEVESILDGIENVISDVTNNVLFEGIYEGDSDLDEVYESLSCLETLLE